jgi:hypothetical protein
VSSTLKCNQNGKKPNKALHLTTYRARLGDRCCISRARGLARLLLAHLGGGSEWALTFGNKTNISDAMHLLRPAILVILFCVGLLHSIAAEEPLIPVGLNGVLLKIRSGISIRDVEIALSAAYPKVQGHMGDWSGQTGYIDYKLDERYWLSVSSITRNGKEVVDDKILFYLYDRPNKRRVEIKLFEWEKQVDKGNLTK